LDGGDSSTSLPLVTLVALAICFTDEHCFHACTGIIVAAVVTNIQPQGTWEGGGLNKVVDIYLNNSLRE